VVKDPNPEELDKALSEWSRLAYVEELRAKKRLLERQKQRSPFGKAGYDILIARIEDMIKHYEE